ncbi:MAG: gluconate 2-dehydrogenase subunit 3 family protein [Acidobacteriota bacterium]
MKKTNRRTALKWMASAPLAAGFSLTPQAAQEAQRQVNETRAAHPAQPFRARFFNQQEYETVGVLVDMIFPADQRSGSATEAGVPQFMDFIMVDQPHYQTAMRGGLARLDFECLKRFDKKFSACSGAEKVAILDEIAWPEKAKPEVSHLVTFFNSFRDLTATGFWTTKMGMEDLQYLGNDFVDHWSGCPDEALRKLGLRDADD